MTKFGMVTHEGEAYCWWSESPTSQGGGAPASPKFLGPLPTPKRLDLQRQNLVR